MTERERRPFATWLAWEVGCLGELVLVWFVLPAATAFLVLVFLAGDLVVVSTWLYVAAILLLVVTPLAVLFTATVGYLRAKKVAVERELAEELEVKAGGPTSAAER